MKSKAGRTRRPRQTDSCTALADFDDRHDCADPLFQGLTEIDPGSCGFDRSQNTKQLNIRIPPPAKRMIERLAKRKTVEVSTMIRMWVVDSTRREAAG